MTITPKEVVKTIKETNIYISSSDKVEDTVEYVLVDFTSRLDTTLDTLKSLPSTNTESISHLRDVQYQLVYNREEVNKELHDYIVLLKLHNIL